MKHKVFELRTFRQLQCERLDLAKTVFKQPEDPNTRLLHIMEELGELTRAERLLKDDPEWKLPVEKMKDSIGDIVIALAGYCTSRSLSFEQCVNEAWNTVSNRWTNGQRRGTDFESNDFK